MASAAISLQVHKSADSTGEKNKPPVPNIVNRAT